MLAARVIYRVHMYKEIVKAIYRRNRVGKRARKEERKEKTDTERKVDLS
jgi:hypothetical protein